MTEKKSGTGRTHKGILEIISIWTFIRMFFKTFISFIINRFFSLFKMVRFHRQLILEWLGLRSTLKNMVYTGDNIKSSENYLVICNHLLNIDMFYLLELLEYVTNDTKDIKLVYASKGAILDKIFSDYNFIPMKKPDSNPYNVKLFKSISQDNKIIVGLFPEGQQLSKSVYEARMDVCEKHNLEPFRNLTPPAPKGVYTLLKNGNYDSICNVTMSFEGYTGGPDLDVNENMKLPSIQAAIKNDKSNKIFFHIEMIPVKNLNLPNDFNIKDVSDSLNKIWRKKDDMIDHFIKYGRFTEKDRFTDIKLKKALKFDIHSRRK